MENAAAEARARRMSRVSVVYSVINDVMNRDVTGPRKSVVSIKPRPSTTTTTTTTAAATMANVSEERRSRRPSRLCDRMSLKSADCDWKCNICSNQIKTLVNARFEETPVIENRIKTLKVFSSQYLDKKPQVCRLRLVPRVRK